MSAAALAGGFAADALLGDPQRLHPVAGFGQVAARAERVDYAPSRARGAAHVALLVAGAGAAGELLARAGGRLAGSRGRDAVLLAVTWAALGGRSLGRTAARVARAVDGDDLEAARATLPSLCGRDPDALDADGLRRATLESVAENTSDAVVGALLWGAVAGPAGVAAYRAANTLDAMVGHRSERYVRFGWAAARLDDVLNWPAARLTATLTVVLAPLAGGSPRRALEAWRSDGGRHPSPNAGPVEAAFAGALGVRLGGPLSYAGVTERRPVINGAARPVAAGDVERAVRLSRAVGLAAAAGCALLRGLARPLAARRPVRLGPARGARG